MCMSIVCVTTTMALTNQRIGHVSQLAERRVLVEREEGERVSLVYASEERGTREIV